jgi:hypothetical protein
MLSVVAPVLAAVILAATAVEVSAAGSRRGWKSTRYGRKGAEMWVEFPRVVYATGAGYSEEHDVTEGLGFGFGMMWGISDNIASIASSRSSGRAGRSSPWSATLSPLPPTRSRG